MKKVILFAAIMVCNHLAKAQKALPQLGKNTNAEVIAAMTTDEKVHFVVGLGMKMPGMKVLENMPAVGQTLDKVAGAAGSTTAILRLGIPSFVVADGPAGLRIMPKREGDDKTYFCTAFPVGTLLASTWDVDLVQKVGAAMGNEVKEYGVDILLAPAINIHRNPLGGRNFEYYSEDPLVSGKIAASMVRGIQSNGVGTSLKHFAANNHEANRNFINVVVSERALREIYLRGFELCVKEAEPATIMSSYNKINGIYTSHSQDLLTKVLRNDWQYKGFVMTDWFGGTDAVEQMKAGNDLLMPGTAKQNTDLTEALKKGTLDEKILDRNIDKMLSVLKEMPAFKAYQYSNKPDLKSHGEIARMAASEGAILLKNERSTLPLSKGKKVVAFGNFSYDLIAGGSGSGDVNEAYTISLVEGLKNADLGLNEDLKTTYENYIKAEKAKMPPPRPFLPSVAIPEMDVSKEQLNTYADADMAIITIGRYSGEFFDRTLDVDYKLTTKELTLIKNVSTTFHEKGKKVAVILNIGGTIDVASWRNDVDAILLAWEGGQEAGNAIADILVGKVNPSGKLATTFAARYEDEPSANNFPGKESGEPIPMLGGMIIGHAAEVNYEEGVYVGYRGYDKNKVVPAYEFGYGLSYTSFKIANISLGAKTFKNKITVTVDVTNTGNVAGKEVVQLYLAAPSKTMDKPMQELKGFAKTLLLSPNQTQKISFELNARDLASFDEKTSTWVAESGNYTINIGASSRNTQQKADFKLPKSMKVEKVSKALAKQ